MVPSDQALAAATLLQGLPRASGTAILPQPDRERIAQLKRGSVQDSTRRSYLVGQNHFRRFLGPREPASLTQREAQSLMESFSVYLFDAVGVSFESVELYITHVARLLFEEGVLEDTAGVRTPALRQLLAGIRNEDAQHRPRSEIRCVFLSLSTCWRWWINIFCPK